MAVKAAPSGKAPAGRLAGRWVPWLVIGLWLVLAAGMVPLSGKLSSVTTDSAVDTLPAGAESTKVAALDDSLPGGEDSTFVFVYHRAEGITRRPGGGPGSLRRPCQAVPAEDDGGGRRG